MCFHYAITQNAQKIENRFKAKFEAPEAFEKKYVTNGFNHQELPVITNEQPESVQLYSWGLIPGWVKNQQQATEIMNKTLNARSETAFEKPSFKQAIAGRRCLVIASGFYEWQTVKNKKYPHFISLKKEELYAMAGIWESWKDPQTQHAIHTFSLLTTEANPLMAKIHNSKKRMPVILPKEKEKYWLENELGPEDIMDMTRPFEEEKMQAHTISKLITSRSENPNQPAVQQAYHYPELAEQGRLF